MTPTSYPPTRVMFIRHGETDWNATRRWQGQADVPLNARGRMQAIALADHLRGRQARRVVSSDLARALDTARSIAPVLRARLDTDPRFREIDIGRFSGLTRDEIAARYPEDYAQLQADRHGFVMPGGESRAQMQVRARAAFDDLAAAAEDGLYVVVAHGGTIAVTLESLFPHHRPLRRVHYGNTSISVVQRQQDGTWTLSRLAEMPHLPTGEDRNFDAY